MDTKYLQGKLLSKDEVDKVLQAELLLHDVSYEARFAFGIGLVVGVALQLGYLEKQFIETLTDYWRKLSGIASA